MHPPSPSEPQTPSHSAWDWRAAIRARRVWWIFPALQTVAVLIVVFALPRNVFLSAPGTDLVSYYVSARAFAAESLRAWHLPLWNPYIYGGQPFLGGFESAVLYPPTLIFVCLPLDRAMNLTLLGHLLILGWGMQYWAARRGMHPLAGAAACLATQLAGPVWPQMYAGHLSNLCTMAWVPWLFAFMDDWRERRSVRALQLAAAAVCLQVLGGHVQYAFYTGVAVGIYSLLQTVRRPSNWWRELPMVAAVYAAGALLAAAQILAGFEAASEGVRAGKVDYAFSSMFSFPPENLLTLVAPGFFGDLTTHTYWGRCYLWEMSLFVGVAGLVLIVVAACDARWRQQAWLLLGTVALLGLLALGSHTPLFRLLYDDAPLFGSFRGISKFTFQAVLFFVLVLAMGADALVRGRLPPRAVGWGAAGLGALAALTGFVALADPALLTGLPAGVLATGESYLPPPVFSDARFLAQSVAHAAWSLVQGGAILLLCGGALWQSRRWPPLRWTLLLILPLEWVVFAQGHFATARLDDVTPPSVQTFLTNHPGDYRILDASLHNNGFLFHKSELWGNDPSVLRRYAEFITATQGGDVEKANQYANFRSLPEVYTMLRLRFALVPTSDGMKVLESAPPMARVQLLSECTVLPRRDELLAALQQDFFNPRRTVYLETPPNPWPQTPSQPGHVRVIDDAPDALTVEADVSAPALLLNTDLYSRSWRARAMPGSVQSHYEVLPANYVLRAVPLQAGHHVLRFEYRPATLAPGLACSGLAWLGWLAWPAWRWRRRQKRKPADPAESPSEL